MMQQAGQPARSLDGAQLEKEINEAVRAAMEGARDATQAARTAAQDAARAEAQAQRQPGTIVFPTNGPDPDITVRVDGLGIHVQQGQTSTTVPIRDVVPDGLVKISWAFAAAVGFLCIGWPIARAIARYIDRRGSAAAQESALRQQFESRFENMERNLDTVAVEMEKVSEAQRFTTRVLTERGEPVPVSSHTASR
ncbi:MAG TPA: hypothetical protein DGD08_16095 [Gemmatimonas aurantiaca]|uniref:Uncharacterized protein n=2 Tax=Gemmatimonas aurantiaca TaxID=173480 RepID=C1A632_GEMAT|nr:hypothetical protein [Gemmatimonas aurantiaca]BAH37692.1 hypothetical protein GAU_0650 [Gemmatimonas aurantiaca T-27]HCT58728.1 hypothetical protein [Gemmatimonas aurantiaca]